MQKIILYNPASVFYTMPLALVALGSTLDRNKYDVCIIDGRLEKDPQARIMSELQNALCLGVTVLTGAPILDALKASRAAKSAYPDIPVVWGGWHPSLFPTETLSEPAVDITVQGQGELTFRELVERLAHSEPLDGVAGISYRDGETVRRNPPRAMTDMNELDPHDYSLIPVRRYFRLKRQRQLDYISSTGCFWRCAFCADPFVYKRGWTSIEPARVAAELAELDRAYDLDEVSFQDETFFTYKKRVATLSEELLRRGCRFTWTATMRADQGCKLSDDAFALMARAGLRRVLLGVESGSQEMLDWMKKDITLEQVMTCAEKCVRHNIGGIFPFIVGFPGETDESVLASVLLANRLRSMSPDFETPFFYFKPYPGSEITGSVTGNGYALPQTLDEWAQFDYIGSSGPWVSENKYRFIERFKFYNRAAWGRNRLARWRCNRGWYSLPFEKTLIESLFSPQKLS
jgi:anaerobic magnesium-protoporphyrin IX monomethyl ester cyclase